MERPVQIRNMEKLECTIFYRSMPSSGKSDSPMIATPTLLRIYGPWNFSGRDIEQLNAALLFTVLQQCAKERSAGKWMHAYRQFSAAQTHHCSFYNAKNATLKRRCILDI